MREPGVYSKGSLDLLKLLLETLKELPSDVGALVSFLGIARSLGLGDKAVKQVVMESYEAHANRAIKRICEEVREKYGLKLLAIYHFIGEFGIGEPLVLVLAAGRHRQEVFAGIQEAIERYKREPALFKKEVYVEGGHTWISHA